jgi:hypothetical protein
MNDWLADPNVRNGLGLVVASLLWLAVSWQAFRKRWYVLAAWFASTAATFGLDNKELSVWLMNVLMVWSWWWIHTGRVHNHVKPWDGEERRS